MARVIVPGSFDPFTYGHLNVVKRAKELYGDVTVGILFNENKTYVFSPEQKKAIIEKSLENIRVPVIIHGGMLYELCQNEGFDLIVKGVRRGDLEYEKQMAEYNYKMGRVPTAMLKADERYEHISSTLVRECLEKGEDIKEYCPAYILIEEYYDKNTKM